MTFLGTNSLQATTNVNAESLTSSAQTDENITNIWKRSSNNTNSYDEDWCRLFNSDSLSGKSLQNLALSGDLKNCQFRSVCWRIFLGILGDHNDQWETELTKQHAIYESLYNQYIIDPHRDNNSFTKDDPLSLQHDSQWNKFFHGQELMKDISQDVVRTFPEYEFFRSASIRNSMINILFCYSQSSRLSYRQGMHEILAPFLFVLHCDRTAYQQSRESPLLSQSTISIGDVLFMGDYLEHDAYSMFVSLMRVIEPWYDNRSIPKPPIRVKPDNPHRLFTKERPKDEPISAASERLSSIHDKGLRRTDIDLYLHLEQLEITAQMFGLRWLRLLFGREFTLQDLLVVWDAVFAISGDRLELIDHVYVSMLVHVRNDLLGHDFATSLTRLMRYPPNIDVRHVVDYALHLHSPGTYRKPAESRPAMTSSVSVSSGNRRKKQQQRKERNKTIVGIETIANRFSSFVAGSNNTKVQRPNVLKYDDSSATATDSAPVTPTNKQELDLSDYTDISVSVVNGTGNSSGGSSSTVDQHQVVHACVSMIDNALAAMQARDLEAAVSHLMRARGVLTGNLTIDRRTLVSELQFSRPLKHLKQQSQKQGGITTLSRSQSSNDINYVNNRPMDLSESILVRLLPSYAGSTKTVELKSLKSVNEKTPS